MTNSENHVKLINLSDKLNLICEINVLKLMKDFYYLFALTYTAVYLILA